MSDEFVCAYDLAQKSIESRLKLWRESGYDIEWIDNPLGPIAVFTNHREGIPCYVEFREHHIFCYGDYGDFIFLYECGKNPMSVINPEIGYMLGKVVEDQGRHMTKEFDSLQATKQFDDFLDEYKKGDNDPSFNSEKFQDALLLLDTDFNEWNSMANLQEFFESIGHCDEWWNEIPDFGMVYREHALAQLVIFQLLAEDWERRKKASK